MRYKVTVNGETYLVTESLKHAVECYNKAIYNGKSGDMIRFYSRKSPDLPWDMVRKDWL